MASGRQDPEQAAELDRIEARVAVDRGRRARRPLASYVKSLAAQGS
ncbi:MAG TPA: hypothetical protein VNS49_05070 [Streptomyces sp.]|nr:hypothetical protein [Streptomyces sp.]